MDQPAGGELGPLRRVDGEGRKRSRRGDGAAQSLERELAVEELGVGRGALKIHDRFGGPAGRGGGLARPIEALRKDLKRPATL